MTIKKIISEYKVLTANSNIELSDAVNQYISDGWQPWGNLVVQATVNGLYYSQVVVQQATPDLRGAWG